MLEARKNVAFFPPIHSCRCQGTGNFSFEHFIESEFCDKKHYWVMLRWGFFDKEQKETFINWCVTHFSYSTKNYPLLGHQKWYNELFDSSQYFYAGRRQYCDQQQKNIYLFIHSFSKMCFTERPCILPFARKKKKLSNFVSLLHITNNPLLWHHPCLTPTQFWPSLHNASLSEATGSS